MNTMKTGQGEPAGHDFVGRHDASLRPRTAQGDVWDSAMWLDGWMDVDGWMILYSAGRVLD